MMWVFPVLTALSAGLDLWICGGTNVTGNRCERKYSLHSNEVASSTPIMRLGRGREWAVKKARMEAKDDTQSETDLDFGGGVVDVPTEDGDKDVRTYSRGEIQQTADW